MGTYLHVRYFVLEGTGYLSYFADEYGQSKMYAEIGTSLVNLASNQTTIERYQCETFEKTEERWTQDYKDSEEKI